MGEGTLAAPGAPASEHQPPKIEWDAIDQWAAGLAEKEDFFKDEVGLDTKPHFAERDDGDGGTIYRKTRDIPLQRRARIKKKCGRRRIELKNFHFDRLIAVDEVKQNQRGARVIDCCCRCGKDHVRVKLHHLLTGNTKSCGCLARENWIKQITKHGQWTSAEYRCWQRMRDACLNPRCRDYPDIGGAGIKICPEWNDFARFQRDMGRRPPRFVLSRKDRSVDFCLDNCEWISKQANDRRKSDMIAIDGIFMPQIAWLEKYGVNRTTVMRRIGSGMTFAEAIRVPKRNTPGILIQINGVSLNKTDWVTQCKVSAGSFYARMKRHRLTFEQTVLLYIHAESRSDSAPANPKPDPSENPGKNRLRRHAFHSC